MKNLDLKSKNHLSLQSKNYLPFIDVIADNEDRRREKNSCLYD